jgi:hypothetical protein
MYIHRVQCDIIIYVLLWNDYIKLINVTITSDIYFFVGKTFKIYLSNFEIYILLLLMMATVLCLTCEITATNPTCLTEMMHLSWYFFYFSPD